MHNRFVNKKRRNINLREMQVENVLPEHFASYYPKFISLLERYYEFQNQNDSTELLNHLFATRDVTETDITLLTYIEDELLLGETYFEGFGDKENKPEELRAAANFSSILFRSKGTKFAIEWFFRSFYGEDVEVLYPKENIFKIGELDSQIGSDSLKYITDDKLYQTFALLIRTGISITKWKDVFKLFAHPAGMYLGGEVILTDVVNSATKSLNDDVVSYSNISYSLSGTTTRDEGVQYTFIINTTDTRAYNTYDAVYWYGVHGTTEDADFGVNFNNGDTGLPSLQNAQYVEIENGVGTFTINTVIDSVTSPAEGAEEFDVIVIDRSGRPVQQVTCTLNDIIPNWTITPQPSAIAGEGTEFTLELGGSGLPYGGETTLRWYLDPSSSATDADFQGTIPTSIGTAEEFTITSGSGSFKIKSLVDGTADSGVDETAVINVVNENDVIVASTTLTLTDIVPVINVTVPDTTEGTDISAVIVIGDYAEGDTLSWSVTGAAAADSRLSSNSGTETYNHNGGAGTIISVPTSSFTTFEGIVAGNFEVSDNNMISSPVGTDSFNLIDEDPVYTLSASPAGAGPNDTVTFTVGGTNLDPAQDYYFYIVLGDGTVTDFNPAPPPQISSRRLITAPSTSTTLTYSNTAPDRFYAAYISETVGGPSVADIYMEITVSASTITPSITNANEGDTITFTIANAPDGDCKYWFTGNVDANDFTSITTNLGNTGGFAVSTLPNNVTVVGGAATITAVLNNDSIREGVETFTLVLGSPANPSTAAIAETPTITINDTSAATYSVANYTDTMSEIVAASITESNDLYIGVDISNLQPVENLFIELSNAGAANYTTTQATVSSNPGGKSYATFVANPVDVSVNGLRDIDVIVYVDGYGVTQVASTTISLNDDPVSTLLSVDAVTPSPIENNDTITFDIDVSNMVLPNDVEVRLADFETIQCDLTIGNTIIAAYENPVTVGVEVGQAVWADQSGKIRIGTVETISTTPISGKYNIQLDDLAIVTTETTTVYFIPVESGAQAFDPPWQSVNLTTNNTEITVAVLDQNELSGTRDYTFAVYENVTDAGSASTATETVTVQHSIVTLGDSPYTIISPDTGFANTAPSASITIGNDGLLSWSGAIASRGTPGVNWPAGTTYQWIDNSVYNPADYKVRYLDEGGIQQAFRTSSLSLFSDFTDDVDVPSGTSSNGYYTLDSSRTWTQTDTVSDGLEKQARGVLQIADIATDTVVAEVRLILTANYER